MGAFAQKPHIVWSPSAREGAAVAEQPVRQRRRDRAASTHTQQFSHHSRPERKTARAPKGSAFQLALPPRRGPGGHSPPLSSASYSQTLEAPLDVGMGSSLSRTLPSAGPMPVRVDHYSRKLELDFPRRAFYVTVIASHLSSAWSYTSQPSALPWMCVSPCRQVASRLMMDYNRLLTNGSCCVLVASASRGEKGNVS